MKIDMDEVARVLKPEEREFLAALFKAGEGMDITSMMKMLALVLTYLIDTQVDGLEKKQEVADYTYSLLKAPWEKLQ